MIENIVIKIVLIMSTIALLFMAVIYNVKVPPLFKDCKGKAEKAFFIVVFMFGETMLLCVLILIVHGVICN